MNVANVELLILLYYCYFKLLLACLSVNDEVVNSRGVWHG